MPPRCFGLLLVYGAALEILLSFLFFLCPVVVSIVFSQ